MGWASAPPATTAALPSRRGIHVRNVDPDTPWGFHLDFVHFFPVDGDDKLP
jgi:hypothetical protein